VFVRSTPNLLHLVVHLGSIAIALCACSRNDTCTTLTRALCADTAVSCDRAASWLDDELVGPTHQRLGESARDAVCRLIEADPETLANFLEKARTDLTKPTRR
jgi:hypothetical protein